ncbi:MAG: ATP-grasp domain-containing protein [Candidatus Hydrogenedens sp.]
MKRRDTSKLKKPVRVMIFPGGTEIGLEIFRSLSYSQHIELFGATSLENDPGGMLFKHYYTGLPFVNERSFLKRFCSLLEKLKIDFIFPAHDTAGLYLAEHQHDLPCKVLISPVKTCRICRDKEKTYKYFDGILSIPKVFKQPHQIPYFPVFLKPKIGEGSKGVFRVESQKELEGILENKKNLLILEYLPGKEYTIDCFTNYVGELIFSGARERIRISHGISVDTQVTNRYRFIRFAEVINKHLKLRGAWFFQMKERANGELVLLEIAPRVSGGMGLFRNRGVNLPLLTVYDALRIPVEITEQPFPQEMQRCLFNYFPKAFISPLLQSHTKKPYFFDHVYIDYDDCLVIHGKLNYPVVLFLIQCKGAGIPVTVLTRHKGEYEISLHSLGLDKLINTFIELHEGEKKSSYIQSKKPIFIDDSYQERKEVYETLKIPVFSVDMIESLIDWSLWYG